MNNNINPFIIKMNDTLPELSINIQARGCVNQIIPFCLSGVTGCTFSMIDEYGNLKISSAPAQVTSASGGTVQYNWIEGDTDEPGRYTAEFQLNFNDGSILTIPTLGRISLHIYRNINNEF